MPAKRALLLALFLLLFLLPLTIAVSKRPTQTTSRGATEAPGSSQQKTDKPQYAKNQIIVKFREAQSILEASEIQTLSQMDKGHLPTAVVKLNQLQPIQSVEKIFKKIELPSSLDQKVPPAEQVNPEANKVFLITFAGEIEPTFVIKKLMENPEVEYAEPNYIYQTCFTPNDPYFVDSYPNNTSNRDPNWNPSYDYQWNLKKIQLGQAWDIKSGPTKIFVAVVDTGVDYTHPEFGACNLEQVNNNLCAKIAPGWNFVSDNNDPKDDAFHGTHIAGIINANTNNSLGIASFDKENTIRILPLKGLNSEGFGSSSNLAKAIDYAIRAGASAVNMSWGGEGQSETLKAAIAKGSSQGVNFVAAAGNDGKDVSKFFPAGWEEVIAVSATEENDKLAIYSNFGDKIDVAAPGGSTENNLLSLAPLIINDEWLRELLVNQKYLRLSGTSMAAPHVAALAALILNQNSQLSPRQVRNILVNSADDLGNPGFDLLYGYGRINCYKALSQTNQTDPPTAKLATPPDGLALNRTFTSYGQAYGENFESYQIEYSSADDCLTQNSGYTSNGVSIANPRIPVQETGLLAEISLPANAPINKKYCLKLTVTAGNRQAIAINTFFLDSSISAGWPQAKSTVNAYTLVADINTDSQREIIFHDWSTGSVVALEKNGESAPGFPISNVPYSNFFSMFTPSSDDKHLYLPVNISGMDFLVLGWEGKTGIPLTNWSISDWKREDLLGLPAENVTLTDLDKDGSKDIIYTEYNGRSGNEAPKIFAVDQQRKALQGWEGGVDIPVGNSTIGFTLPIMVGNVAGEKNSPPEIVGIAARHSGSGLLGESVFILNSRGKIVKQFPVCTDPCLNTSLSTLADINNDGRLEILAVYHLPSWDENSNDELKAYDAEGHLLWSYFLPPDGDPEKGHFLSFLTPADFDGDLVPEIFTCSSKGTCAALDGNGQPLKGFPTTASRSPFPKTPTEPSLLKLKNGHLLIVQGVYRSQKAGVHVAEYNPRTGGFSVPSGFPKLFFPQTASFNPMAENTLTGLPVISDLDNDGFLDIVVSALIGGKHPYTYVYNTALEVTSDGWEWPQYLHDENRTGVYPIKTQPPPTCRTCENFTGCLVGKTCMQICQTNPDQCESQPCEAGAACTCRSGAPEEYRCPN